MSSNVREGQQHSNHGLPLLPVTLGAGSKIQNSPPVRDRVILWSQGRRHQARDA